MPLPLAYSPGKARLSINQYLVYERRALDLISPNKVTDVLTGDEADRSWGSRDDEAHRTLLKLGLGRSLH